MAERLVASSDIPFGDPGRGVFAFRVGDQVPAELVETNGWQDYVVGANTKAGKQAAGEPTSTEKKG